jgi:hypothetical protein
MAGVKITNFLGKAPKISPELLPEATAQIATNCKLYSGDLIPYPIPVVAANTNRTGTIKTLYGLRDPGTDSLKWLSWLTNVDIVVASATSEDEQRFYYSGDGAPKVSNYALATAGVGPYPTVGGYYDLGLPLPEDTSKLTTTPAVFTAKTTASYARDASNTAKIITSTPHGLRSGNFVTVTGFSYKEGTYSQPKGTNRTGSYYIVADTSIVRVTMTDHGFATGDYGYFSFSGVSKYEGSYQVVAVNKDEFTLTVNDTPNTTAGGTITWENVGTVEATITILNHGLDVSASVTLDFTTGTGIDGTYSITEILDTDRFKVVLPASKTTGGVVRWDVRSFNGTSVECTVEDDTTFTYFSPGPKITTTPFTGGKVDIGGLTQDRTYVYTWVTPWKEESIASRPSDDIYIKDGITVTVTDIPTAKPAGNNFVRGVRVYRTVTSTTGTEYFRLKTLWFPTDLASVARTSGVGSVTTTYPHNLDINDRFKISGCSNANFNVEGLKVTDVVDDYTFEFTLAGADIASVAATGTLYHDASEDPVEDTARWWGFGNYDFIDDFETSNLLTILSTDNYDAPPDDLQGLTVAQNNILVGFRNNELYFSEPNQPHAWPEAYKVTIEYDIVGLTAIAGNILVTTTAYPYLIQGSDPAAGMSVSSVPALYPCLSENSIVTINGAVLYATHDGLVVYTPGGIQLITKAIFNNDTWNVELDPKTLIAVPYGDAYVGSHSTGALVYEREEGTAGSFVDLDYSFTAAWYDTRFNRLYYTSGVAGDIYLWDELTQPAATYEWKSKVFKTANMINLGAARVIADYAAGELSPIWEEVDEVWEAETCTWDGVNPVTFRMWADKELILETPISDSGVFRLPAGYRSDTFEVGVEADVRIRAIHLAETPSGLREV